MTVTLPYIYIENKYWKVPVRRMKRRWPGRLLRSDFYIGGFLMCIGLSRIVQSTHILIWIYRTLSWSGILVRKRLRNIFRIWFVFFRIGKLLLSSSPSAPYPTTIIIVIVGSFRFSVFCCWRRLRRVRVTRNIRLVYFFLIRFNKKIGI